ncbi:EF-P lysine aminoacylase EpmA [Oceanicoccus sp. KOV_DT_Chl]|uniref:EF-P lysine aminoacylase EpmA n=1 Tax=Oceanicoccus sp. KOV_DT_Chl TaxID=1904639 RepID=UPI000C7C45D6|nr:EF-P lysine aminoacylase EpmA [Oceanicoccus sp. KOV_DT_Chl]
MTDYWRPSASMANLHQRAALLAQVRLFFAERKVLEVETPLLAQYSVTDPYMDVVTAENPLAAGANYFLQTSPEYAMKRLLAVGSGPIYQISKAFRKGELGSRHNPEFSMLEWYRPGFDEVQLMEEVADLLKAVLNISAPCQYLTYRDAFQQQLGFDPHLISCDDLQTLARAQLDIQMQSEHKDDWLNLLMAEIIEPNLDATVPVFITDYPASQAALAKTAKDARGVLVAKRFELYFQGMELANGYCELTNAEEQQQRFQRDQQLRAVLGREPREIDRYLLAAVAQGLPACAGVALGFDRLLMLVAGATSIKDVISFTADRA